MPNHMKLIYIAGKFRGPTAWDVEKNIRKAEALSFEVATLGASFVCPHTNTRYFDGTLTDEFWLAMTMEMLRRCDAVMLCDNWVESAGAREEVKEAHRLGIPVFEQIGELEKWLKPKQNMDQTQRVSTVPLRKLPKKIPRRSR